MIGLFPQGKDQWLSSVWRQNQTTSKEESHRQWNAEDITRKARVVCGTHNNGLMSTIENESKPMLTELILEPRGLRKLTERQQRLIANWVTLRAMVYDRARNTDFCCSTNQIAQFRDSDPGKRKPPTNSHVWLATVADDVALEVFGQLYSRTTPDGTKSFNVFNCLLGKIAIQVFGRRGLSTQGIVDPGTINFLQLQEPSWNDFSVRIWPRPVQDRSWPPPKRLTSENIMTYYGRFYAG